MASVRVVADRYLFVEGILDNVLRFTDFNHKKVIDRQMLCEQMYWGIRRDMAKELLQILDGGGDAYSRINNIKEVLKQQ